MVGWVAAADHDGSPWIAYVRDTGEPDDDTGDVEEPYDDSGGMPDPVLVLTGIEPYVDPDGTVYTRHDLRVVNWDAYDADLFMPAPDLEPCGNEWPASRTVVSILDGDGADLDQCGLSDPRDLNALSFAVRAYTPSPESVSIQIWDRQTDSLVDSNPVAVPRSAYPIESP